MLRPIPSAPGYLAREDGMIAGKLVPWLKSRVGSNGYPQVMISVDGKYRPRTIHSLVCEAFHGTKPKDAQLVRHLDGNKLNNHQNNLRWGTYAENEADKISHGTALTRATHGRAKLTDDQVQEVCSKYQLGSISQRALAKEYDVTQKAIWRILHNL